MLEFWLTYLFHCLPLRDDKDLHHLYHLRQLHMMLQISIYLMLFKQTGNLPYQLKSLKHVHPSLLPSNVQHWNQFLWKVSIHLNWLLDNELDLWDPYHNVNHRNWRKRKVTNLLQNHRFNLRLILLKIMGEGS